MKKYYNSLFDKITSDMSDSELLYKALRKAEDMENKTVKRSYKKSFIALCAAVGVLAAGTVAVGAVNNWNFKQAFEDLFRSSMSDIGISGEAPESDTAKIDFAELGCELDMRYEFEAGTFVIRGAISDGNNAYVLYDVELDEKYAKDSEQYDWGITLDNLDMDVSSVRDVYSVNGNVVSGYQKLTSRNENGFAYDHLTFMFYGSQRFSKEFADNPLAEMDHFRTEEFIKLPLVENKDMTITVDAEKPVDLGLVGVCDDTTVTVTPLGIRFTTSDFSLKPIDLKAEVLGVEAEIVFNDGTSIKTGNEFSGSITENGEHLIASAEFDYPINSQNVVSVSIGNSTIAIK